MHCAPIVDRLGATVAVAQSFDQHVSVIDSERHHHRLSRYGCLDEATGVPNRGYTRLQLRESMNAFLEYHLPFAILLIQVEKLADFRAAHGHAAGDTMLHVVAESIRNTIHSGDFLGRWEENQFLLILSNCSAHGVQVAGDRISRLMNSARLQWWGDQHAVTTRMGRTLVQEADSLESLLARAVSDISPGTTQSLSGPNPDTLRSVAANASKG
ncbi:MAG TPA: diguanylate cyclase [Terriglobales bacterium]